VRDWRSCRKDRDVVLDKGVEVLKDKIEVAACERYSSAVSSNVHTHAHKGVGVKIHTRSMLPFYLKLATSTMGLLEEC